MKDLHTLGGVERCPHCSVSPPLLLQMWRGGTPSTDGVKRQWGFFACVKCGGGIAAASGLNSALLDRYPVEVYPSIRSAHEDIPVIARQFLQQAFDTLHAPDAAGVMAGSAVDAMLKELGYEKGSVYERIDRALADNKLTEGMAAWAHSVRLGANRPRHADKEKPHLSVEEAKQSVDFAEALGNFLFVLSAKIERGIAAANAANV